MNKREKIEKLKKILLEREILTSWPARWDDLDDRFLNDIIEVVNSWIGNDVVLQEKFLDALEEFFFD